MAFRKNKKRIDPRYFLHETTYRDLNEQDDGQSIKAILDKVWRQFNETGLPSPGRELNKYGGENCRDQKSIERFTPEIAEALKSGKTFVNADDENLHKIALETNQQLEAFANTSGDYRVEQIASEYNKLLGLGYKALEAVRAMNAEDPRSISLAITACCDYSLAAQFNREKQNGGDQRGISAQIQKVLGN